MYHATSSTPTEKNSPKNRWETHLETWWISHQKSPDLRGTLVVYPRKYTSGDSTNFSWKKVTLPPIFLADTPREIRGYSRNFLLYFGGFPARNSYDPTRFPLVFRGFPTEIDWVFPFFWADYPLKCPMYSVSFRWRNRCILVDNPLSYSTHNFIIKSRITIILIIYSSLYTSTYTAA